MPIERKKMSTLSSIVLPLLIPLSKHHSANLINRRHFFNAQVYVLFHFVHKKTPIKCTNSFLEFFLYCHPEENENLVCGFLSRAGNFDFWEGLSEPKSKSAPLNAPNSSKCTLNFPKFPSLAFSSHLHRLFH